ncbi:MAG TPA: STY0301 family protein [Candidatus Binatus sp.]|uniref:STY0301 family protein n=1 Tax=Candidatus Binatus sp. TaxID=2811406 RepID=UPI002B4A457E|nr:STY0301 family protein [Candidatus Binatus sp.]HKN14623.1 STY0301 family protein [Candidatus Binatus sp.]
MKRLTFILIAFACSIAPMHFAQAESACPATIAVEQKASAPAPDWTVTYSGYQTAIVGVTIFDGPPAEQASLVPDNEKTSGDNIIQTWQLAKSARGYWLQCNYANTTAQISRRLPAEVTRCDVIYDHNLRFGGGGNVVKSVNCK